MSRTSKYYKPVEKIEFNIQLEKDAYFLSEIAELIGCVPQTLSNLYKQGKFIEFDYRIGHKLYYKREKIEAWLKTYRPSPKKLRRVLNGGTDK